MDTGVDSDLFDWFTNMKESAPSLLQSDPFSNTGFAVSADGRCYSAYVFGFGYLDDPNHKDLLRIKTDVSDQ